MVQTYPSMSLRTFVNVIKLILHNLENTEFFDGILYNMLIILCQFEDHRSDALP